MSGTLLLLHNNKVPDTKLGSMKKQRGGSLTRLSGRATRVSKHAIWFRSRSVFSYLWGPVAPRVSWSSMSLPSSRSWGRPWVMGGGRPSGRDSRGGRDGGRQRGGGGGPRGHFPGKAEPWTPGENAERDAGGTIPPRPEIRNPSSKWHRSSLISFAHPSEKLNAGGFWPPRLSPLSRWHWQAALTPKLRRDRRSCVGRILPHGLS